jgi:hypothetical protein
MNLVCKYCGRIDPNPIVEYISETETRVMCRNCYSLFNSCASCQYGNCALESYQGPLPIWVMETIRQGNMVAQRQIPNPEVVKITCMVGCKCYEGDDQGPIACHRRQHQICRNYSEVE